MACPAATTYGPRRSGERALSVEERGEPRRPRRLRVAAPVVAARGPGRAGARLGAAAGVAAAGRRCRQPQGHRPRPAARGGPRVRRAGGPVHSAHRGGAGHPSAVRVPTWDMHCCVLVFPLVMLKLKHKMKMRYTGSSLGDILLEDLLKETITH